MKRKKTAASNLKAGPPGSSKAASAPGSVPAPAALVERTDQEKAAIQRFEERRKQRPSPPMKVTIKDGRNHVDPDHSCEALGRIMQMDVFATASTSFFNGLLHQLANFACPGSELKEAELNFAMAIVKGIGPRDETETLLAGQMAAVHFAMMTAARSLANVDTLAQQDSASNMLNKLGRTFAVQVETLKKYRSSGEQNIRVQHVTVNDGGQAVVGDVHQGGGAVAKSGGQPHEPSRIDEQRTPLLGNVQAIGQTLPSAGGEKLECVPLPRRARRRA